VPFFAYFCRNIRIIFELTEPYRIDVTNVITNVTNMSLTLSNQVSGRNGFVRYSLIG